MLVIAMASLVLTGCKEKSDYPTSDHPSSEHPAADTKALCPKCGEVAGSEACCMQKAVEEMAADAEDAVEEAAETAKETVEKAAAEHPTEHPK